MSAAAAVEPISVSEFESHGLDHWESRAFAGRTDYRIGVHEGRTAVQATADSSASGIYREIQIDLARTPILEWWWQVESTVATDDPRQRSGDDYAARVYVVFPSRLFWRTTTVNYVWADADEQIDDAWPNPYTANAQMLVVRAGDGEAGQWVRERRDVRADYQRLFGRPPPEGKLAVAIMTDTDDTQSVARAWFADLRFLPPGDD